LYKVTNFEVKANYIVITIDHIIFLHYFYNVNIIFTQKFLVSVTNGILL